MKALQVSMRGHNLNGRFIFDQAQELVFCLAATYCIHQPDFQLLLMTMGHYNPLAQSLAKMLSNV
jgi:hypothetical protein